MNFVMNFKKIVGYCADKEKAGIEIRKYITKVLGLF